MAKSNFIPDAVYRTIMDNVPIATVDILLFNKQKTHVLLFRRENKPLKGVYFSPGGRMYKGETLVQSAIRQAKRELGLILKPSQLILGGAQTDNNPNSVFPGVSYHCLNVFFAHILDTDTPELTLDSQHSASRWISVKSRSLHPLMKSKIRDTLLRLR